MTSRPPDLPDPDGRPLGWVVRRGLRLSVLTQVVTQLGSIVATVILARILLPAEFGVVALAQSVLGVTALVSLAGINTALVTRRGDVDRAASTFFWFALGMAGGAVLLMTLIAGPVTSALGLRGAAPYLVVLSFSFAADLLALVPLALLQRRLGFGWINMAQAGGATLYFVGEVVLALAGRGAWSVVVAQVAGSVLTLVLAMLGARWLPRHRPRLAAVRGDVHLTAGLGLAQLLSYVQKNVDYWVVSRMMGPTTLGVYYIAYVIPNIVRLRLSTAMRQVLVPTFATADGDAGAEIWRRTLPLVMGAGLPVLTGLAATAPEVVAVFFGPTWEGAVTPLRILTIATAADLLMTSVSSLAMARRVVRPYLVVLAVRAVATAVLASAAAASFGTASAVAWAVSLAALVALVVQEIVLSPRLRVPLVSAGRNVLGYAGLSAAMLATVLLTSWAMEATGPLVRLVVLVIVGTVTYVGLGSLLLPAATRAVVVETRRVLLGR